MNGAACQGRRQLTDERHCLRSPGAKLPGFMVITGGANDKGAGALVTAVEDTAQFVAVLQERVGLVDQQRRLPFLYRPKECCRRDIGGVARTRDERAEERQARGLATFRCRTGNGEHWADVKTVMGMGVKHPECKDLSSAFRQHQMFACDVSDVVKQSCGVNRLGPGFGVDQEIRSIGDLRSGLAPDLLHLLVECPDSDPQAFRLDFADPVIFERPQCREPCHCFFTRFGAWLQAFGCLDDSHYGLRPRHAAALPSSRSLKSAPRGGRAMRTRRPSRIQRSAASRAAASPASSPSANTITSCTSFGRSSARSPDVESAAQAGLPVACT